jgi:hypothetical protein
MNTLSLEEGRYLDEGVQSPECERLRLGEAIGEHVEESQCAI